ncbi:MAG TPA: serine protease [Cryomorphaceae bacterium]|nr:serine protease [Cryomorphaceae bacterium]
MLPEKLYTIAPEDWNRVEEQFEKFYPPVYIFVTENKGSLDEARKIYIDSFIYYARSLELHGPTLIDNGQAMVYSFARKLWIKKLHARRADTSFIRHRREFLEVDDAFDDIDLIDHRTDVVSKQLAEIGEPARTLTLEYIGHGKDLEEVMRMVRSGDKERTYSKLIACLRRLIEATEKRKVRIDDERFAAIIDHLVHPDEEEVFVSPSEEDKVDFALIARTVAIIRSYVKRKEHMLRLQELSKYHTPDKCEAFQAVTRTRKTGKKMKPLNLVLTVASIAMVISALTSFGVLHMDGNSKTPPVVESAIPSVGMDSIAEPTPPAEPAYYTAFAVAAPGYYITSSEVGSRGAACLLRGDGTDIRGKVIYSDTTLGLAVVFDPMGHEKPLPYMPATEATPVGETVFTVGYPKGGFHYAQGVVSTTGERYAHLDLKVSTPGAPVFGRYGTWVGVIVKDDDAEGKSKVLHVDEIRELLENVTDGEDYPKAKLPRRNRLYYDDRPAQVDKIRPLVRMIEIRG